MRAPKPKPPTKAQIIALAMQRAARSGSDPRPSQPTVPARAPKPKGRP